MSTVTDSIPRFGGDAAPSEVAGALGDTGVCIVEGRLSPNELAEVRAAIDPLIETSTNGHDDFEGFETCRLGAMLSHTEAVHPIATDELIVAAARQFLKPWCHQIQLMLTQVIAIGPGETAPRRQTANSDSQALGCLQVSSHALKRVVLPKPAGAEMRVNLRCRPSFSRSIKRGRSTTLGRGGGI